MPRHLDSRSYAGSDLTRVEPEKSRGIVFLLGRYYAAFLRAPLALFADEAPAAFAAHRCFSAATIGAGPAALSFRFGFFPGPDEDACFLTAAHRFRCASAIALRPEAPRQGWLVIEGTPIQDKVFEMTAMP